MAKKNDICDCNSFEMGFKKDNFTLVRVDNQNTEF